MLKDKDNYNVGLEAAIFLRKRNSSLIQFFCFENVQRLKLLTETVNILVAERSVNQLRYFEKSIGDIWSEYTGISSLNNV